MELPALMDGRVVASAWEPGLEVFPDCRLVGPIAKGGFGVVWRAEWKPVGLIALKRILVGDSGRDESRALTLLKGIRHRYLASIYGFRRHEDLLLVAMELGDETLEDRLQRYRRDGHLGIPGRELLPYVYQVAEALDYLYRERQVLHRDVKPSNILRIGEDAKVCDFGLAKALQSAVGHHSGVASFQFAPPEFFEGVFVPSSDQFCLASSYVYCLTGKRPFPGPRLRQLMVQHVSGRPILEDVPVAQQRVLRKALARDPNARFETCLEFAEALIQTALDEESAG